MAVTLMPPKAKATTVSEPKTPKAVLEQRIREDMAANAPDWLGALRQRAFARFEALGLPNPRRDEAWKYVPVRSFINTAAELVSPEQSFLNRTDILPHLIPAAADSHIVLIDGVYAPELSTVKLPEDFVVMNLAAAVGTHGALVQKYLANSTDAETDALTALNTAAFADGVFVYLPAMTRLEQPLQVLLVTTGGNEPKAAYSRVLVVAEREAKASVFVQAVGLPLEYNQGGQRLNHVVHEIYADEKADVEVVFFRRANAFMHQLAATHVSQQAESRVSISTVALDGMPGPVVDRHSVVIDLHGEGAECVLNGLSVLSGTTEVYNHTVINHHVPNCESHQLYKNILDDEAKAEFFGTIVVDKDAIGTNSQQLNKTLLLSDNAKVWTRPQLQISADDVKCAHGAAVGQLDEMQLFYLKSRGIDEELATCLLTYGFAEDVVEKIGHPAVRKYLDGLLLTSLNHAQNPLSCDHSCNTCEIE